MRGELFIKLVEDIQTQQRFDIVPADRKGEDLVKYYEEGNSLERSAVNEIFTILTGWDFETLIKSAGIK
jgi:hypothetical protein